MKHKIAAVAFTTLPLLYSNQTFQQWVQLSKKIFLWGIFIAFSVLYSSCGDSVIGTGGNSYDISGKVVDNYGNPIAGAKVEIVNVSAPNITISGSDGSFVLKSVSKPYDIAGLITDTSLNKDCTATIFTGVWTSNPILSLRKRVLTAKSSSRIKVTYPDTNTNPNHKVAFIFWDNSGINQIYQVLSKQGTNEISKSWFTDGNLTGKAAILGFYLNGEKIISYDKYGEKPLNISRNGNVEIIFTEADTRTNPAEIEMNLNITLPSGLSIDSRYAGVSKTDFYNFDKAGIPLIPYLPLSSNNIIIPSVPGINFKFFVKLNYRRSSDGADGYTSFQLYNGGSYLYTIPPVFDYPPERSSGILPYYEFSISNDHTNSVNVFSRVKYSSDNNTAVYLYTTNLRTSFPVLSEEIFNLQKNSQYKWSIERFDGINTMDKMLTEAINVNPNLKSYCGNLNSRSFTSGNW